METHNFESDDAPAATDQLDRDFPPTDETPEQRADIGRALHGIFTERFGTRIADRVMPSADELARSHNSASPANPSPPAKKRRRRPKPKRSPARSPQQASIASHEARCTICSHPECSAIEEAFVHWANSWDIARDFGVKRRAIYRHAHAFRLFAARNRNLRYALGYLVEEVDRVTVTGDSVVRAIHALARVNDKGEWVEPPSHVIVSRGPSPTPPQSVTPVFDVINPPALSAPTAANPPAASARHSTLRTNGIRRK